MDLDNKENNLELEWCIGEIWLHNIRDWSPMGSIDLHKRRLCWILVVDIIGLINRYIGQSIENYIEGLKIFTNDQNEYGVYIIRLNFGRALL